MSWFNLLLANYNYTKNNSTEITKICPVFTDHRQIKKWRKKFYLIYLMTLFTEFINKGLLKQR